jgi:fucose 4-O-acetylase-like acetyltransferase
MSEKLKVSNVDIVKGIGIILVMIGHSGMFLPIKDLNFLNVFIYSFHMPLFFIAGGFFLKDKIFKSPTKTFFNSKFFLCVYSFYFGTVTNLF